MERELLSIPEACRALNCGRTQLYQRLKKGEIKAVKLGKKTLILKPSLVEFIASLNPYANLGST